MGSRYAETIRIVDGHFKAGETWLMECFSGKCPVAKHGKQFLIFSTSQSFYRHKLVAIGYKIRENSGITYLVIVCPHTHCCTTIQKCTFFPSKIGSYFCRLILKWPQVQKKIYFVKVQLFWKSHKNLKKKSPSCFDKSADLLSKRQNKREIFCGLLTMS